jgi:hypothetical protein
MSYDDDIFPQILISVVALAAVAIGGLVWASASCESKWARSGMHHTWGPVQGCMIEVQPGKWIPEERWREFDK